MEKQSLKKQSAVEQSTSKQPSRNGSLKKPAEKDLSIGKREPLAKDRLSEGQSLEVQLLRDQALFPTRTVLNNALNDVYSIYVTLMNTITQTEYGLTHEWRFYNDGKSWLCKVSHKKKTVFWLSAWKGYIQIGFYFTEKHIEAIATLDINEKIKNDFLQTKPIGKLLPMIFKISQEEQLADLLQVVKLKKSLK